MIMFLNVISYFLLIVSKKCLVGANLILHTVIIVKMLIYVVVLSFSEGEND